MGDINNKWTGKPDKAPADERPVNPAYKEAKKYDGKKETDPAFNKFVSSFWKYAGLPNYKTIVGTSFAWCMLIAIAMNVTTGVPHKGLNGLAQSNYDWVDAYTIDYLADGLPQGAQVNLNHNANCARGSSGNHQTWADGDCTPEEIKVKGARFPGYGGNQSNAMNTKMFCVKGDCSGEGPKDKICAVKFPKFYIDPVTKVRHEIKKPTRVTVSKNCKQNASTGGSTR